MAGGKFAGGTGTALDPFLVEDAHDFNAMRLYSSGYYFQLIKDINMNQPPYNTGTGWQPIGYFNSQIDGQGHKVSGLRIWSKGDAVGLFLSSGTGLKMTNLHFDDLYFELITADTANKKFTLFGYEVGNGATSNDFFVGSSVVGKFKIDAPSVTARLLVYSATQGNDYAHSIGVVDSYFDLENLGSKQIMLFGYLQASTSYPYRGRSTLNVIRTIIRLKGDFTHQQLSGNGSVAPSDLYLVNDIDTNYVNFGGYTVSDVEFLSKSTNLPNFVSASQKGRQVWMFPGTTYVRMVDYSRNKFLIEANGEIYSYNVDQGFFRVGATPILTDMFTLHGMDYIESIPVSVWNQLRQDFGQVDIHCYVEKIPGKTLVTNRETLAFNQALNNKVVMKAVIDFSLHNNDISKIRIPATDQAPVVTEPTPTEPSDPSTTDPGTTEPVTDPGTTEPTL